MSFRDALGVWDDGGIDHPGDRHRPGQAGHGGGITFDPSNIHRKDAEVRTAAIGKDGSYTVTTLVGENMVSVQGKGVPTNSILVVVKPGGVTVPIDVP